MVSNMKLEPKRRVLSSIDVKDSSYTKRIDVEIDHLRTQDMFEITSPSMNICEAFRFTKLRFEKQCTHTTGLQTVVLVLR